MRALLCLSILGSFLAAPGCSLFVDFDDSKIPADDATSPDDASPIDTGFVPADSGGDTAVSFDTGPLEDSGEPVDGDASADVVSDAADASTSDAKSDVIDAIAADTAVLESATSDVVVDGASDGSDAPVDTADAAD